MKCVTRQKYEFNAFDVVMQISWVNNRYDVNEHNTSI